MAEIAAKPEQKVELTREDLLALIEAVKKPYVDPRIEAQKEADRAQMREEILTFERNKQARIDACSHMRPDNTSAIAWITNSDGKTRGVCQHCPLIVQPDHPDYLRLIKIPTRGQSIVYA